MMSVISNIVSQIRVMQEQERSEAYRCNDYLSYRSELGPADRQALCNWGFQTIAAFHGISRFTVVKAISYFDRYMCTSFQGRSVELEAIQLAFVASLVIALKVDSGFNVEIDFVASVVTKDAYDEEEISRMEMEILQALGWRLSGPTPHDFIDRFLQVIPGIEPTHFDFLNRFSKAVAELATVRYSMALQCPSVISFAAICFGLEYLRSMVAIDTLAIQRSLQNVSGLNCEDPSLKSVVESMAHITFKIPLDDLYSFAGTDGSSVSSEDSPVSTFRGP
jgi:hypothetical protein